jgi:hypothetical protein
MLHCDLEEDPSVFYFAFWRIFDFESEGREAANNLHPLLAKCSKPTIKENGSLSTNTLTGSPITVDRELCADEKKTLDEWKESVGKQRHAAFDRYGPSSLRGHLLDLRRGLPIFEQDLRWIE